MTNQTTPSDKGNEHLPDAILEESTEEIIDLPRPGIPKAVKNVTKADARYPDVLIQE